MKSRFSTKSKAWAKSSSKEYARHNKREAHLIKKITNSVLKTVVSAEQGSSWIPGTIASRSAHIQSRTDDTRRSYESKTRTSEERLSGQVRKGHSSIANH